MPSVAFLHASLAVCVVAGYEMVVGVRCFPCVHLTLVSFVTYRCAWRHHVG